MTDVATPAEDPDAPAAAEGPDVSDVEPAPDRARFPVQRAKAQRPPLRPDTLHRDRLLDWLAINIHHRLVLLVADAGYGKTTLLSDFARQTRLRTLWFRVDDEDRDWISVLHYLVAAGREADPSFASATAERLAELGTAGGTRDEIVRTFLGELARLGDEPTVLIVDDYHVLDESPDARSVIADILVRAPERFTVVLATRRRPALAIARLRALGEVAELTTDDLRFTEPETEALFRDAYHQPLEPDVLSDLARRTEGWAASLQLVRAAVRERSTIQIRAFVRALSGVDENLYDYLAEEVVGELEPAMQDFLMRTSILQVVDPALSEVVAGIPQPDARRLIEAAERIGLLSRRGEIARHTVRYHPLVRDFLEDRLRRDIGDDAVADLHRTVARYGESTDWRLAAYHYAAANDMADVRRVVAASLAAVVGGGDLLAARDYLLAAEEAETATAGVALDVISARIATSTSPFRDVIPGALRAWEAARESPGAEREVALFTLMYLLVESGDVLGALERADQLLALSTDASIREIAGVIRLIVDAAQEGSLLEPIALLRPMLDRQVARGQRYFAGVTALNLAAHLKVIGNADEVARLARQAIVSLDAEPAPPALGAAHAMLGWALAHQRKAEEGWAEFAEARRSPQRITRVSCLAEFAESLAWFGDSERADAVIREAVAERDAESRGPALDVAVAEVALACGKVATARRILRDLDINSVTFEAGQRLRHLSAEASLAALSDDANALASGLAALDLAHRQHAQLYVWRNELTVASIRSGDELDASIRRIASRDPAVLSMCADIIVGSIDGLSSDGLALVMEEASCRPKRWATGIRRVFHQAEGETALRLGRILDEIGGRSDVAPLRKLVKRMRLSGQDAGLGARLARRLAPRIVVLDQDRVQIEIGARSIPGSEVRRKVLALLCFLVSRSEMSATKEQVAEALWPDLGWEAAANSLNQTAYFLRRVFEPDYKEGVSVDYLRHESDILWLDPELVESQSRHADTVLSGIRGEPTLAETEDLVRSYRGQFALDFTYEDWASEYRNRLHAKYLEVMERFVERASRIGSYHDAIWAARSALAVDPSADRLEESLVRLYRATGATSAAAEQYSHYSTVLRNDLGLEPPALADL